MTDFGQDTYLGPEGLQPDAGMASGRPLVLAALWRRVTTDPASEAGRRIYGARCYDLRALQASIMTEARAAAEESAIAHALRYDDRVEDAAALLQFDRRQRAGTIKIAARLVDGRELAFVGDLTTLTYEELTSGFPG